MGCVFFKNYTVETKTEEYAYAPNLITFIASHILRKKLFTCPKTHFLLLTFHVSLKFQTLFSKYADIFVEKLREAFAMHAKASLIFFNKSISIIWF